MTLDKRELQAMREEILLRIALIDIAAEEVEALERDLPDEPPNQATLRALGRAMRRRRCMNLARHALPRAAHAIGAVALALYLALTAALAFSADARQLFISALYAGVLGQGASSGRAPAGWTEKYYPTYIPAGWTLHSFDPAFGDVVYRRDEGHIFQFGVYGEDAAININTDGALVRYASIGDSRATVAENAAEGYAWVTWSTGDRKIVIYIDADAELALRIAAGVRPVGDQRK